MHIYTILLIGAWILGSGLVAYVCDNLGRKLGKKRLSLWGMRPRHTAMVFTVLTGVGIAAVTVMLVALMVPDARMALFQSVQINEDLKDLTRLQENLKTRNRILLKNNNALEQTAKAAETRARRTETKAEAARVELVRMEGQRDEVRRAYLSTKSRLQGLIASRKQLARQVEERQQRLASMKRTLAGLQGDLSRAQSAARIARKDRTEARNDQIQAEKAAQKAQEQVALLQKNVLDESRKLEALSDSLKRVSNELELTQTDLDERRRELSAVSTGYVMNNIVFRNKPLLYSSDQEIARRVIYNTQDQQEVNLQIVKLLEAADEEARAMGAAPEKPGHRAVQLIPFKYMDESNKDRTLEESEQILKLSQEFVKNNKDVVIRVVATANIFEGEAVKATLKVSPNSLVFKRGDVIAKDYIDGRMREAEILKSLIEILQTRVRYEAIRKGMIPSPAGTLGDLNWDHMLEAVNEIRTTQKMTEVQIISFTDAWTADPLTVRFILPS
ncbi:MAG: DUF3084 domain-containing protein [Armatimonadetes bacterium]|nr:DUF3084 domain-containing protein [Armatimonadota bacterium]